MTHVGFNSELHRFYAKTLLASVKHKLFKFTVDTNWTAFTDVETEWVVSLFYRFARTYFSRHLIFPVYSLKFFSFMEAQVA